MGQQQMMQLIQHDPFHLENVLESPDSGLSVFYVNFHAEVSWLFRFNF